MKGYVDRARSLEGRISLAWVLGVLLIGTAAAQATAIPVGDGTSQAEVTVEFADGASYVFEVLFDGSTTGLGLMDIVEACTTLTTVRNDFGWGVLVDGISYEGHSNVGYDGGENWWHYWIKAPGGAWESPSYGAVDRTVTDGSSDAWIYGRAGMPAPEPAAVMLATLATKFVLRRSRRVG